MWLVQFGTLVYLFAEDLKKKRWQMGKFWHNASQIAHNP